VRLKPIGAACVIVLASANLVARAQATTLPQPPPAPPPTPVAQDVNFDQGTWTMSLTGSYVSPIRFSDDRLYNLTLSGGYYVVKNTSINFELSGYYAEQPDANDTAIGGFGVLFRTHLLSFDKWTIFIDGGGGVNYADDVVPEFGTRFNFTAKVGPGITYELNRNTHLVGGARYFHLSNGQIHGRDQNPSYDGVQFWGGVMWTF
jgi:hypothetical protein